MRTLPIALVVLVVSSLARAAQPEPAAAAPTPEEARKFVEKVNADLLRLMARQATADWIKATYITDDTERNSAAAGEDVMAYLSKTIKESLRFEGLKLDPNNWDLYDLKSNACLFQSDFPCAIDSPGDQRFARQWSYVLARQPFGAAACRDDRQDLRAIYHAVQPPSTTRFEPVM